MEHAMSRRVYLLGVGIVLVAMGLAFTDWMLSLHGVTEANAKRIRPGMPMAKVEALLGKPDHKGAGMAGWAGTPGVAGSGPGTAWRALSWSFTTRRP
jgi:hypothetical protein